MPAQILKKLIKVIAFPVIAVAAMLAVTSTGVLSQKIPGTDAKGNANMTCVYFFTRGFKNEAIVMDTCPSTITLKDLHA